mmetsp:Transcript_53898/g.124063  ORF Transcript_53898/g.124063 Transcript_53898/m.124063 type:complete len:202 (+) Transcript_53898:273-878(+)
MHTRAPGEGTQRVRETVSHANARTHRQMCQPKGTHKAHRDDYTPMCTHVCRRSSAASSAGSGVASQHTASAAASAIRPERSCTIVCSCAITCASHEEAARVPACAPSDASSSLLGPCGSSCSASSSCCLRLSVAALAAPSEGGTASGSLAPAHSVAQSALPSARPAHSVVTAASSSAESIEPPLSLHWQCVVMWIAISTYR